MTTETLNAASRRHGLTDERMGQILSRAGLYTRGRHNVRNHRLHLDPAAVDRVMAEHRARGELRRAGIELPPSVLAPPPAPGDRYVITCAVAAPTNPGRVTGAWVVRLGALNRLTVADVGECSTHRGALLTVAAALIVVRAQRLPVLVRCNQLAAVKALKGASVELTLRPRALAFDEGVNAVLDAVRAGGVPVEFDHIRNDAGDNDLDAARAAAGEASRKRGAA